MDAPAAKISFEREATQGTSGTIELVETYYSASGLTQASHSLPLTIPVSQLYYWTDAWQRGERESLRELGKGKAIDFEDASSAIRWLLTPDE